MYNKTMKTVIPITVALLVTTLKSTICAQVIQQSLLDSLKTKDKINIVVELKTPNSALLTLNEEIFSSRAAKIESLQSALISAAHESQKGLISFLEIKLDRGQGHSYKTESVWVSNRIFIDNADSKLVEELSTQQNVITIREEIVATIPQFNGTDSSTILKSKQGEEVQWGVDKIRAPEMWNSNITGEGITIAFIDSGVNGAHRVLRGNFLGDKGWFDPIELSWLPKDTSGHGTHCAGSALGQEGYGVAPGAKWMACLGCPDGKCQERHLLRCAQFVICPTNPDGTNPGGSCTKTPHIVSNSWSTDRGGQSFFDEAIANWHRAGIIPVFAIGNSGPWCGTVKSPGDRDVIGVGATTRTDSIAPFSSVGSAALGSNVKPDLSAPGENIRSAFIPGDSDFATLSGTSMAAPHVAGAIALLLSYDGRLNYDRIRRGLLLGAERDNLVGNPLGCGAPNSNNGAEFPNYIFGYGRLDVRNAVDNIPSFAKRCSSTEQFVMFSLLSVLAYIIHV